VYDDDGLPVPLPDEALPVELPPMADFRPVPGAEDSEPAPPLARAEGWASVELDLGDGPRTYRRELNTMPQWAGSCWYYLRYTDPANDREFVGKNTEHYWMAGPAPGAPGGVGLYVGGVEHAVLHLLYARFWHKVLYDLGHVSTPEPFGRLFNQGYILADAFTDERGMYVPADQVTAGPDGAASYQGRPVTRRAGKMGKSLKNGISPDEIYGRYGADTLRLYEMAMGPLSVDRPWRTDDITGVHRFLQRLWRLIIDETTGEATVTGQPADSRALRRLHQTIAEVREDYGALRFNTAIARLIELTSLLARIASDTVSASTGSAAGGQRSAGRTVSASTGLPRTLAEPLVLMLAPLAPHVAEELWSRLGHQESLTYEPFPVADEALAAEPTVALPVQVNGKTRLVISVPAGAGREEVELLLRDEPEFASLTAGLEVRRLVIVPDRIVNVVTG
jgi:leucyl-tRNA synthetase